MASYDMCNGISQHVRDAVKQINKVGVGKFRRYVKLFHPRADVDKAIAYIRVIAQFGCVGAARRFNITPQCAQLTLKRYYEFAKEAEKWQG